MQLTMKPCAKASVALMGASVIAVSAVAPHPEMHLQALPDAATRSAQIVLRDLANPLTAITEVLQTTVQNIDQLGAAVWADPAPILTGVLTGTAYTARDTLGLLNANLHTALTGGLGTVVEGAVSHTGAALGALGSSAVQAVPGAVTSTIQLLNTLGALGAGTLGALLTNTPADLGTAFQLIRQGDLGDALQKVLAALILDPLLGTNANNPNLLGTLFNLAAGPFSTVAKILQAGGLNAVAAPFSTVANLIQSGGSSLLSTAVLGAFGTVAGLAYSVGDGLQKMANGVASLNLGKIYNGMVNGLTEIGTAVSNVLFSPTAGVGIPGLLLNLRNAIADWLPSTSPYKTPAAVSAAKNSAAAIPSTTSTGVTITPTAATATHTKPKTATSSATADATTGTGTGKSDSGKTSTTNSGTDKSDADKTSTGASGADKTGAAAGTDNTDSGKTSTGTSGADKPSTGKSSNGRSTKGNAGSSHRSHSSSGHGSGGHGGSRP